MSRSKILNALPMDEIRALVRALLKEGASPESVIDEVSALLDELVDFRALVGGLVGRTLEQVDRIVISAVVRLVVALVQRELAKA